VTLLESSLLRRDPRARSGLPVTAGRWRAWAAASADAQILGRSPRPAGPWSRAGAGASRL